MVLVPPRLSKSPPPPTLPKSVTLYHPAVGTVDPVARSIVELTILQSAYKEQKDIFHMYYAAQRILKKSLTDCVHIDYLDPISSEVFGT